MNPESIKLLIKLYTRPSSAMGGILDHGSWLFGAAAVFVVSLLFQLEVTNRIYASYEAVPAYTEQQVRPTASEEAPHQYIDEDAYDEPVLLKKPLPVIGTLWQHLISFSPSSMFTTILTIALLYVPLTMLVIVMIEPVGSFGVALRRDYGALLACTLMAWAAAHLPFALVGFALRHVESGTPFLVLWVLAKMYFGALMIFALRTVFGTSVVRAAAVIAISCLSVVVETYVLASRVIWYLASPWVLLFLYSYFRGSVGDIGWSYRSRQNFRQNLEAATINPRDSGAHYQLGLIYHQRRQYSEAIARFKQAVEINPGETDAHFQLGRIARVQGRLQDAINHFNEVVQQDDKHAQNEIWREVGATYEAAGMWNQAREALETYVERREFDAEGLYRLGKVLEKQNHENEARSMFERCVESVKTMPYYRRSEVRRWQKLAEKQLRNLRPSPRAAQ